MSISFLFQEAKYDEMSCQYNVVNSVKTHCIGRYIHPGLPVTTTCKRNYYMKGPATAKCEDASRLKPKCIPCSCHSAGSTTRECKDQSGICSCRTKSIRYGGTTYSKTWFGQKCNNIDCSWSKWGSYSK